MLRVWPIVWLAACYEATPIVMPSDAPPANFLEFCPPSYDLHINVGRYRFIQIKTSWIAAEADCIADRTSGTADFIFTHLAVLTDLDELAAVGALTTVGTWVGYTDQQMEDSWIHINGDRAVFPGNGPGADPTVDPNHPWNEGEPNGGTNESCAYLINTPSGRKLDDRPCNDANNVDTYVCECTTGEPVF